MKIIFFRKPIIKLLYFILFTLFQYYLLNVYRNHCKEESYEKTKKYEIELGSLQDQYNKRLLDFIVSMNKSYVECVDDNMRLQIAVSKYSNNFKNDILQCEGNRVGDSFIRDFYRYECKSLTRYPELEDINKRVDGAYYACEDGGLKLKYDDCIVLSFGIYYNDMFDEAVNGNKSCLTHSFDPFNEPERVRLKRDTAGNETVTIKIREKWMFHSIGITNEDRIRNVNKTGWLDTYEHILNYLDLNGKVIDIFKIDTEGAEWESIPYIMSTKPELLCKYVKQIAIETHSWLYTHESNYKVLKSLEVCFRLYRRDQRFYLNGEKTEWDEDDFKLSLSSFINEVDLARFLFTYGELYFINKRFL